MSPFRATAKVFSLSAALALAGQGSAIGQTAFPRSALQPSAYTPNAAGVLAGGPASSPAATQPGNQTMRIDLGGPSAPSRMMSLPKGKSAVIELPVDARDVLVSDPKVADVVLSTPRRIYVLGVSGGQTDAVFFDANGRQLLNLNIRVDQDISAVAQTLNRILPGASVRVEGLNDNLILSGEVASLADADKAVQLARSQVSKPEQVINMLSIASPDQVMLKVRIVEVDRTIIKQLGFNNDLVFNAGTRSFGFNQAETFGVNGSQLGGASACAGQNSTKTTNYTNNRTLTNNNTTANQTNVTNTSTNGTNGTNTTTIGTTGTNTTTNGTNGSSTSTNGTTGTTANGTSFNGTIPSSVTVRDVNGNLVTIPGTLTATNSVDGTITNALNGSQTATNAVNDSLIASNIANNTQIATNVVNGAQTAINAVTGDLASVISAAAATTFSRTVGNSLSGCLAAFERVGLVRTLAEPNLTAVSGEAAKFLAGGEFPVPTGRDNNGQVTIEFKPYGVGLGFTPVVLSQGRISMKISTEYSEITNIGSLSLGTGSSSVVSIPGLSVRRAETMVELPSGGAMMIAGLLQSTTKSTIDSLPGLLQLPVLGALFRSRDFLNNESELVVIVTPYIVKPTSPDNLQTPADGLKIADDMQTVLLGKLNTAYGRKKPSASDPAYQGPYGYVVD